MDIYDLAEGIKTQEDFVQFLEKLRKDLVKNEQEWENNDLASFLSGLEGYCHDKKQVDLT